jgi:hypothetical protein
MSYLDSPRLHFRGFFQADVSTINNDVRMYQNASFVPEYQQLNQNGSWNPEGTAIFRFLDCSVTAAVAFGSSGGGAGLTVQNADQRAPGKLVDLDPQQQMVSQIWGMQIRVVDAAGKALLEGDFKPAAFINLWRRQLTGVAQDQQLTAAYQSVLENVQWHDVSAYATLQTLKDMTQEGLLSIHFNVFGYGRDSTIPRYTMGHVAGTIGPYFSGEPKHFTRGRQMIASGGNFTQPAGGLGNLQGKVAADGNSLTIDFGNTFPIETANSGLKDIGPVFLGVLTSNPTAIQATVTADQVAIIGEVPYQSADWYDQTAGVQAFDLTNNSIAKGLLPNNPLVILTPIANGAGYNVRLQESIGGFYVRADNYVYRIDPGETQTIEFYADRFGTPLPNTAIALAPTEGFMGGSGGGPTVSPTTRPTAAIPDIGTPADAIAYPATLTTDSNGYACAQLTASKAGPGAPRGYLQHQLYGIGYQLSVQPTGYVANPMNYVSILAYTGKSVPEIPTWYRDIQALFTQYGNLYPIMGRYVVDLDDYDSVVKRLKVLSLAFSLPIEDPNHMPVTRDLGAGDRATILKWLSSKGPNGLPVLGTPEQSPAVTPPGAVDEASDRVTMDLLPEQTAGKTSFLLQLEQRNKAALTGEGDTK